jgi:hypothetical protein
VTFGRIIIGQSCSGEPIYPKCIHRWLCYAAPLPAALVTGSVDPVQEFDDDLFRTSDSAIKIYNEQIIDEFRANDGKVGGLFQGFHVLLLTTTGAKLVNAD